MFENLINTDGIFLLSKETQRIIQGGGTCIIYLTDSQGSETMYTMTISPSLQPAERESGVANDYCANFIINEGNSKCGYDCAHGD